MRYSEIIEAGDDWASRFAATQKTQAKMTKLRKQITRATVKGYQHHRQAADTAARDHDRVADLQTKLTEP